MLRLGLVVVAAGTLMALRATFTIGTDISGQDYGSGFARSLREFGKLGALFAVGVGLPIVVGAIVGDLLSSHVVAWAVAGVLFVVAVVAEALLMRRLQFLRLDSDWWAEAGEVRLDAFHHRSGVVFWTIVALAVVVTTLLLALGVASLR